MCGEGAAAQLRPGGPEAERSVADLRTRRLTIIGDLVQQAAACLRRRDTGHAVFSGCVDWHSAVHGTYAVLAYTRVTGDRRYAPLVDASLTDEGLRRERRLLESDPLFEMPYGRAWFLRLAIEHRRQYGPDTAVASLAAFVAESLLSFYTARLPDPHARDYDSAAWAMVNLIDYGRAAGNPSVVERASMLVRERFTRSGTRCESSAESDGFMAVCATWAWAVERALPNDEFRVWYAGWQVDLDRMSPIVRPRSIHASGLNFSRAWGLWDLAVALRDGALFDAYVRHFEASYSRPEQWRGNYLAVGHWVSQFGVFAALPLFGEAGR